MGRDSQRMEGVNWNVIQLPAVELIFAYTVSPKCPHVGREALSQLTFTLFSLSEEEFATALTAEDAVSDTALV